MWGSREKQRGYIGLVILLIVLLVMGYLVIKSLGFTDEDGEVQKEKLAPQKTLDRFRKDIKDIEKKLEERQKYEP